MIFAVCDFKKKKDQRQTQFQPKIKPDKWNEVYLFHSVPKMNESQVTASTYSANETVTKDYI